MYESPINLLEFVGPPGAELPIYSPGSESPGVSGSLLHVIFGLLLDGNAGRDGDDWAAAAHLDDRCLVRGFVGTVSG